MAIPQTDTSGYQAGGLLSGLAQGVNAGLASFKSMQELQLEKQKNVSDQWRVYADLRDKGDYETAEEYRSQVLGGKPPQIQSPNQTYQQAKGGLLGSDQTQSSQASPMDASISALQQKAVTDQSQGLMAQPQPGNMGGGSQNPSSMSSNGSLNIPDPTNVDSTHLNRAQRASYAALQEKNAESAKNSGQIVVYTGDQNNPFQHAQIISNPAWMSTAAQAELTTKKNTAKNTGQEQYFKQSSDANRDQFERDFPSFSANVIKFHNDFGKKGANPEIQGTLDKELFRNTAQIIAPHQATSDAAADTFIKSGGLGNQIKQDYNDLVNYGQIPPEKKLALKELVNNSAKAQVSVMKNLISTKQAQAKQYGAQYQSPNIDLMNQVEVLANQSQGSSQLTPEHRKEIQRLIQKNPKDPRIPQLKALLGQ